MKTVLSIAGFDPTNGAGIGADILTLYQNKVYPLSITTSITSQNALGVKERYDLPTNVIQEQFETLLKTHFPSAIKIGMIGNLSSCMAIFETLFSVFEKNTLPPIVIDPVIYSTSGALLTDPEVIGYLKLNVLKHIALLTPNLPEYDAFFKESEPILSPTLIKGGHSDGPCDDILRWPNGSYEIFHGKRYEAPFTHGTGCTLSSAIAAGLANEFSLSQSIYRAKEYLVNGLTSPLFFDTGYGTMRK